MAPARPRRATHLGESWSVRPLLVHNTAAYKEKTLCRRAAAAGSTHIACYNMYRVNSAIAPGSLRSCVGGAADAAGGIHRRCDPPGPRGGGHCPHGGHDCADGIHGRQDSLPIVVPVGKAFDLAVRLVQLPSSDTETTGTVKVWLSSAVMLEMQVAVVTPPPRGRWRPAEWSTLRFPTSPRRPHRRRTGRTPTIWLWRTSRVSLPGQGRGTCATVSRPGAAMSARAHTTDCGLGRGAGRAATRGEDYRPESPAQSVTEPPRLPVHHCAGTQPCTHPTSPSPQAAARLALSAGPFS